MSHNQNMEDRKMTITVGGPGCDIQGFTSRAIQAAVDETRSVGGGAVKLDPGIFRITGPIRLYEGTTLQGAGKETVLLKSKGVKVPMTADADYGELQVEVLDAAGFEPGMGIQVFDASQKWGWAESTAVISRIDGNTLFFDRNLERDYDKDDDGTVTNACSLIEAVEAANVRICDLAIDGCKSDNFPIGGCRGGGIYLYKSKNCRIENVEVRNFNGDGISWQICEDVAVDNCVVTGCSGSGLHPGAGSTRTKVTGCDVSDNGLAGLFVCWRVQYGAFSGNRFCRNGSYGICIGHRDSDNVFEENDISGNGFSGIYFRPEKEGNGADRNRWIRNTIEENGNGETGYGIYANGVAAYNIFMGNQIGASGSNRQKTAVWLAETVLEFDFQESPVPERPHLLEGEVKR